MYIYMFFLLNFSHVCDVGVDPPDMEALLGWSLRPTSSSWGLVYLVLLQNKVINYFSLLHVCKGLFLISQIKLAHEVQILFTLKKYIPYISRHLSFKCIYKIIFQYYLVIFQ